jgi:hypothetical protein
MPGGAIELFSKRIIPSLPLPFTSFHPRQTNIKKKFPQWEGGTRLCSSDIMAKEKQQNSLGYERHKTHKQKFDFLEDK